MANFKEGITKSTKAISESAKKLAGNETFTKIVLPVGTTTVSTALAVNRIVNNKKQHKEHMKEYEELSDKIDKLTEKVEKSNKDDIKKEKMSIFKKKKKRFSLLGGGFGKPAPRSLVIEGIKKVAEESRLRSSNTSSENLLDIVKTIDDPRNTFNSYPEDSSNPLSLYQSGDILIITFRYLDNSSINKLNQVLESYCRTFKNTDYSSELSVSGTPTYSFVEVWIAENSLEYLVKRLISCGFSINVIS